MNEYQIASLVGVVLSAFLLFACLASRAAQKIWGFIDDSEPNKNNWVISKINKFMGGNYNNNTTQVFSGIEVACYLSLFVPMIILLSFKFYSVTLSLLLASVLAYLSRMVRRGSKIFNAHVKDNSAHKG